MGERGSLKPKDSRKLEPSLLKSELSQRDPASLLTFNTVLEEVDNTNHKLNKNNNIGKEETNIYL